MSVARGGDGIKKVETSYPPLLVVVCVYSYLLHTLPYHLVIE